MSPHPHDKPRLHSIERPQWPPDYAPPEPAPEDDRPRYARAWARAWGIMWGIWSAGLGSAAWITQTEAGVWAALWVFYTLVLVIFAWAAASW